MKKALIITLSLFPLFALGKSFTKEDIDNTHKYIILESIYFNMRPAEIIGLHCLSVQKPSDSLMKMYPNLKDESFSVERINANICKMATSGLLSFEEIERYKNEIYKDRILNLNKN